MAKNTSDTKRNKIAAAAIERQLKSRKKCSTSSDYDELKKKCIEPGSLFHFDFRQNARRQDNEKSNSFYHSTREADLKMQQCLTINTECISRNEKSKSPTMLEGNESDVLSHKHTILKNKKSKVVAFVDLT